VLPLLYRASADGASVFLRFDCSAARLDHPAGWMVRSRAATIMQRLRERHPASSQGVTRSRSRGRRTPAARATFSGVLVAGGLPETSKIEYNFRTARLGPSGSQVGPFFFGKSVRVAATETLSLSSSLSPARPHRAENSAINSIIRSKSLFSHSGSPWVT
jgi:hypothetical protein